MGINFDGYLGLQQIPYILIQFPRKLFFFEFGLTYCDIKVWKLFKGGNYLRIYGKCAETIQGRKLFKGRNYMRKYGKCAQICICYTVQVLHKNIRTEQGGLNVYCDILFKLLPSPLCFIIVGRCLLKTKQLMKKHLVKVVNFKFWQQPNKCTSCFVRSLTHCDLFLVAIRFRTPQCMVKTEPIFNFSQTRPQFFFVLSRQLKKSFIL